MKDPLIKKLQENFEFQWGERHSMISAEYWADSYGSSALGKPRAIDFIEISKGNYLDTYASRRMLDEWQGFSRLLLNERNCEKILKSSIRARKNYWNFYHKFQKIKLAKISNIRLFNLLKDYYRILEIIANYFGVSQPEGLDALTKKLHQELDKRNSSYLISTLITATKPDIIFQQQLELNKIANQKQISREILYSHALKHAWLFFNSYNIETNIKFLRKLLKEKFDYRDKLLKMQQLQKRQGIIFKSLKNKEIQDICLFLQKMAIERLELKNCWAGAEFRFLSLFHEIFKRIHVPFGVMMEVYTLKDFENALLNNKNLTTKQIQERTRSFVLWKNKAGLELIEDPRRIKIIARNLQSVRKITKISKIHGTSANPGRVVGRCRLVQSIDINQVFKDLKKFKKGNILVTWMTQPNMVPIVRKAAAIIADEGGITSHAAVVAREFNIPCVVGTKIATKVLHNGQLVEVDANRGIVKVL